MLKKTLRAFFICTKNAIEATVQMLLFSDVCENVCVKKVSFYILK